MRAVPVILAACVGLISSSCGGGQPRSPVNAATGLKPRDVFVGSWKIKKEDALETHVEGYDFAADNTLKVHYVGAKELIKGTYTFLDDFTVEVAYDATEEAKKAYADAVKAYKTSDASLAKQGKVAAQVQGAIAGIFARIPDQLPATEKLTVFVKSVPAAGDKQTGDKRDTEMTVKGANDFSVVYRKEE
jgi:hypothetical protein